MQKPLTSPDDDELLAMAYADGELAPEARATFEARLRREPKLAREVASHRRLQVLARSAAGPEPAALEWERIAADPLHRASRRGGWALMGGGAFVLVIVGLVALWSTGLPFFAKLGTTAVLLGLSLVFVTILRGRLATLDLDPYRDLKR